MHVNPVEESGRRLREQFIGREKQIGQLELCYGTHVIPPCVVVYGQKDTGKTTIVRNLLQNCKEVRIGWIECSTCVSVGILYKRIINKLLEANNIKDLDCKKTVGKLKDNVQSLKNVLSGVLDIIRSQEEGVSCAQVIVFDDSQCLREMGDAMQSLLSLPSMISDRLSFIFIEQSPMIRYQGNTMPLQILFPPYNPTQLLAIIQKRAKDVMKKDCKFPSRYLPLIFHTLGSGTGRSISEIENIIRFQSKMLREAPQDTFDEFYRTNKQTLISDDALLSQLTLCPTKSVDFELPTESKYLLFAAYLASYNSAKNDSKYFVKHTGITKTKAVNRISQAHMSKMTRMVGPQPFALERMIAIFNTIAELRFTTNVGLFRQIATLASLNFITKVGSQSRGLLQGGGKWKVNASLDFVTSLSKDCNFQLDNYLAS